MLIRVIDLETTGFEPPEAGVCEIGWCDLEPAATDLAGEPLRWKVAGGGFLLVNPGRPITPETSAVHHIVDEDVTGAPDFADASRTVLFDEARMRADRVVLVAHNAKFERQFLTPKVTGPVEWVCTYKCALRLWLDARAHSNMSLRYERNPIGLVRETASLAHRAYPDAYVTAFHIRDMLAQAPLEDLIAWSNQPALQVKCYIGKWRGTPWRDVDYGFLRWVSEKDFDEDVLFTVRHEMDRRNKEWEAERAQAAQERA